ncbi:MAG: hypothetical protein IPN86_07970 [Saprospiraceae bacterium]|nr:hypothetical protein [Saprospiraceae bacterium]
MNEQTQTLQVRDTQTGQDVQSTKIISKDKTEKWRIKTDKGYKYITQKEIDTYQLRKEIGERPKDELQYRNNVEATIFQLGITILMQRVGIVGYLSIKCGPI